MDSTKPVVIPVIFKVANYLLWSRTTRTALCGRELWNPVEGIKPSPKPIIKEDGYADSTIKEKEEEGKVAEESKRFQDDQTVLGLLQNSHDAPILDAYSYCETAKDI